MEGRKHDILGFLAKIGGLLTAVIAAGVIIAWAWGIATQPMMQNQATMISLLAVESRTRATSDSLQLIKLNHIIVRQILETQLLAKSTILLKNQKERDRILRKIDESFQGEILQ